MPASRPRPLHRVWRCGHGRLCGAPRTDSGSPAPDIVRKGRVSRSRAAGGRRGEARGRGGARLEGGGGAFGGGGAGLGGMEIGGKAMLVCDLGLSLLEAGEEDLTLLADGVEVGEGAEGSQLWGHVGGEVRSSPAGGAHGGAHGSNI